MKNPMNETKCCKKCLGHGLPANLPKVNVAPVQDVPFCLDHTCSCHQSEKPHPFLAEENIMKAIRAANQEQRKLVDEYNAKPQPEQWEELREALSAPNDAKHWYDYQERVFGAVSDLLLAQKEQMLEGLRGMKMDEIKNPVTLGDLGFPSGYNSALSDVEEKIRGL